MCVKKLIWFSVLLKVSVSISLIELCVRTFRCHNRHQQVLICNRNEFSERSTTIGRYDYHCLRNIQYLYLQDIRLEPIAFFADEPIKIEEILPNLKFIHVSNYENHDYELLSKFSNLVGLFTDNIPTYETIASIAKSSESLQLIHGTSTNETITCFPKAIDRNLLHVDWRDSDSKERNSYRSEYSHVSLKQTFRKFSPKNIEITLTTLASNLDYLKRKEHSHIEVLSILKDAPLRNLKLLNAFWLPHLKIVYLSSDYDDETYNYKDMLKRFRNLKLILMRCLKDGVYSRIIQTSFANSEFDFTAR